ncbi:dicarboxylate/amino acid:cation symporter [Marivirga sp.]|uniref:dicarboxylate/amino acid:cation symporter n=1 Tax=Marivirga sp. TaxID=2018662 RepID=UPI002D80B8D5|nr:cation:dicarboxylase symporter family transporter [Marivirga sp.]HET8860893.1 cation:dicarboxylase symporter family transporter [Marivirga sp.]
MKKVKIALFITGTITLILGLLQLEQIFILPSPAFTIIRWALWILFFFYACLRKSLTTWILVSMLIGAELGNSFPEFSSNLQVLSQAFLKLIKVIIAPLLLGTLVVGIAGHSNLKQVGSMGWKALLYFEVVTTLALFIGLFAINLTEAGKGIDLSSVVVSNEIPQIKSQGWQEIILHIFPENIAKSIYEGQILQIVIFSILFGLGLAMVKDEQKRRPMISFAESLSEVMFKFTNIVMFFAPFGVGAAIAYTVSHMGLGILVNLFYLLATLYGALLAFLLLILLPIALAFKVNIKKFIQAISEPVSIAFATTSSEAALPKAMENLEKMGVSRRIVAFVMPTGYSFNLDGTTLYLSLATVFVAQAAGISLSWGEQLLIVFTLMLTSKGVAGVPRASLVILLGTAATFGLPVEPIFIILGIDELMDMARTSVNVIGNCLATVLVGKWEGEFTEVQ